MARYPAGSVIYTSPDWVALRQADGRLSMDNLRIARGPTLWDTLVIHFPRARGRCADLTAADPQQVAADVAYRRLVATLPTLSGRPHIDMLLLSEVPSALVPPMQPDP